MLNNYDSDEIVLFVKCKFKNFGLQNRQNFIAQNTSVFIVCLKRIIASLNLITQT